MADDLRESSALFEYQRFPIARNKVADRAEQ